MTAPIDDITDIGGERERDDSEEAWEAFMDATQTFISLRAGYTLTEADIVALKLYDDKIREDDERAIDAFHRGYQGGLAQGAGADTAELINKLDAAKTDLVIQKALGKFAEQFGFRKGAQACREMIARFVEQGGDPIIANSIRLNWSPTWGDDPGAPTEETAS